MSKRYMTDQADFDIHVGNKSNPHDVTAAQTGADINYGDLKNVNILEWAVARTAGGTFLTDPTVVGVPNRSYWRGVLFTGDGDKGIFITDGYYNYVITTQNGTFHNNSWMKLVTSADLVNYLPLSGGILNDNLVIAKNNYPGLILNAHNGDNNYDCGLWNNPNGGIYLQARKDGRNRLLFLNDNSIPLQDAIMMWYYDDGNEHNARVFGEHNTSLLASTMQNLIQTGEVSALDDAAKATLSSIEEAVQKNYAEVQQESADTITLELLERGVI